MERKGSCRLVMTENAGGIHQRSRTCVPWSSCFAADCLQKQADGQTSQTMAGKSPTYPSLPPTMPLPVGSKGSFMVDVCERMLSVFRFTLAPWVSRRIRMLDGPALRAGKDFSRCRPSVFRTVYLPPRFRGHLSGTLRRLAGVFMPPCPVMIGRSAFKLFNSVGILSPLRLLACRPGRRQTAKHVGI